METTTARSRFYKLYFSASDVTPPDQIYLFYQGRPLYCPARFRGDRYAFDLPRSLEAKMMAGELIADFNFADIPGGRVRVPGAILLSDRYE